MNKAKILIELIQDERRSTQCCRALSHAEEKRLRKAMKVFGLTDSEQYEVLKYEDLLAPEDESLISAIEAPEAIVEP